MAEEHKTEGQEIADQKGDETTVTIKQDKIDSLISSGYKKGAEKATAKLLGELGAESIDDVKAILKAKQDADEAEKTEFQKLQDQLEAKDGQINDLQTKLSVQLTDSEVRDIALDSGISPEKVKYFKMDYLEAKKSENFDSKSFIEGLKETQPDFFGVEVRQPANIDNPPNKQTPSGKITMVDYSQLSAKDRKKYKASDIIR